MRDDLRHTLRALRSHPGPLSGAVLTLALAIGINAAMAGLVGRAFLAPRNVSQTPAASSRSLSNTARRISASA